MATASAPGTSRGRKSNQSSGPRLVSGNMRGTWPFVIPALIAYGFVVLWPSLQGSVTVHIFLAKVHFFNLESTLALD